MNIARFLKEEDIKFAFYSALELRNCIERTMFEYLVLIKNSGLSKQDINVYRPSEFISKINEIEPKLEIKLKFIELILKSNFNSEYYVIIPDFCKLNKLYGQLGNYLHAAKIPKKTSLKTKWFERLTYIILESKEYLIEILSSYRASITETSQEYLDLYEKYRDAYPNISSNLEIEIKNLFKPINI